MSKEYIIMEQELVQKCCSIIHLFYDRNITSVAKMLDEMEHMSSNT